jgi:predicted ester cyclase
MEETMTGQQSLTRTQQNLVDYFNTHDVKYVAEDAVFHNMSTGQVHRGRAEVGALLHYIYHVAFDARGDIQNYVITEDKAVLEFLFKGRHIGEFAGIQPTQKEVNVPTTVNYNLKDGLIQEARIYMLTDVLLQQLGGSPSQQKTAYITRDIFQLKFGHFRDVKVLIEEARKSGLLPDGKAQRVLTDFTGNSYRLIFEEGFDSLGEYEKSLSSELNAEAWQQWYKRFKEHVESSHREILKQLF